MTGIPTDTQEGVEALSDDSCSIHLDVTEHHDENSPRLIRMAPTTILPLHQRLSSAASHSQQHTMAWDLAPIVVSPCTNQGELYGKVQSMQLQTPQHIATVVIASKSSPDVGDMASDDVSQVAESPRVPSMMEGVGPVLDQGDGQESKVKFTETVKQNSHQQRLDADISSTKSCWCAPLIWKERYLIVAVNTGEIRAYGNLLGPSTNDPLGKADQRHDRSFAPPDRPVELIHVPLTTLFLESDAAIVQLLPLEDRDVIVALSVEGHVHVVQWLSDETLQIQNSWTTGGFGATCMTSVTRDSQPALLLIGYTTGIIDCWKLLDETLAPSSTTKSRRPVRKRPICLWKGRVHGVCAVQSLATMPATTNPIAQDHYVTDGQDDDAVAATFAPANVASSEVDVKKQEPPLVKDDDPASAKTEAFNTSLFIIVVIQSTIEEDSPMVHAFDLDAILGHRPKESLTATLRIRDDVSRETETKTTDILALASFRILPDPAMGLLEVEPPSIKLGTGASPNNNMASIVTSKFHIPNVIIPKACRATSMLGSPVVAVTMWNGTVAQLSPGWGVGREQDQFLFSYPVVSVGSLMYQSTPHWALGLRGGTCYLIPVADDKPNDNVPTIRVIMYPHDIDADNSSIYVQELTAGNLQDEKGERNVPVLLYVMPGGVVDIYSCDLVATSDETDIFPSEDEQVLEALIKQGCLDMVIRMLQERKDTICHDNDHDAILWNAAYDEVMVLLATNTSDEADADNNQISVGDGKAPNSMPFTSRKPRTLDDLHVMPSLRTLLLSLANRT